MCSEITTTINNQYTEQNTKQNRRKRRMENNFEDKDKNENEEEEQYLRLLRSLLSRSVWEEGRNGRTCSVFGHMMRFSLAGGRMPILTTKATAWKTCFKELMWFVRGDTNNALLNAQKVHIWDANAGSDVCRSLGYPEHMLGPIYGAQWRHFNGVYDPTSGQSQGGVDQLKEIIDVLSDAENPVRRASRRLIMTAWNPSQLSEMALPPCHVMCQFNVHEGNKLSCALYQRSVDVMLGQPFNIASYAFLTHLLAHHCGLEAFELVYFMGNCHLYENATEAAAIQCERRPHAFPTIAIQRKHDRIEDYVLDDIVIQGYVSHGALKVPMVV